MTNMSGMDLLIQREQEKAESKRQKPKMNPGKVKIEGLLGKLPEAGSHNINFQQIQQQHQQQQQQQQQQRKKYHNPSMYDYYTNGRSSVPPVYNQQQQFYQVPNFMSNGNLYNMTQQPSRPNSTMQYQKRFGNQEYTI
ncbi:hypothetical protein INT48_000165 [Thamnidium elegans]|uniref:Uncharacterized protein n=1 Tax=Thamnidium elegans TaxID=101142 RepID=A0A8H7SYC5_9FUNG|nr:hypothetical protein INT48_000165 [Thamnidium elegans]